MSAMLAAFFIECAGEAEMKILTCRVQSAVRALAVAAINPRAVAFTTEEIGFRERFNARTLLFLFL